MNTIELRITAVERNIFEGVARRVFAPAKMGEVCIYPQHAPFLTLLNPGDVCMETEEGGLSHFYVSGGILHVLPKLIIVLADTAMRGGELDGKKAQEAKDIAEKAIENMPPDADQERFQLMATVMEATAKLEVIRRAKQTKGY